MKTIDLGYKSNFNTPVMATEKEAPEEEPEMYPMLNIPNKPELLKSLSIGDTVTAMVNLKVTSVRESNGNRYEAEGCSIEFDVLSMSMKDKPKQASKGRSAKEAMDEYFEESD